MAFFDNLFGSGKTFSTRMRYVNDFKIEEYQDARGKTRTRAVYTGPWTVLEDTGGKTLAKLIGAAALAAAGTILLFVTLLSSHLMADKLLVMIPLYVALFPTFYLLMGAFSLPYRLKPMRRDQYMHGIMRMQRSSVAIIVFITVGVIASFIYRISTQEWWFQKKDILFLVGCVVSALLCAGVLFLLGSLDTRERPNETYPNP